MACRIHSEFVRYTVAKANVGFSANKCNDPSPGRFTMAREWSGRGPGKGALPWRKERGSSLSPPPKFASSQLAGGVGLSGTVAVDKSQERPSAERAVFDYPMVSGQINALFTFLCRGLHCCTHCRRHCRKRLHFACRQNLLPIPWCYTALRRSFAHLSISE